VEGVPERTPVGENDRPGGKAPVNAQVYGPVPPVALNVTEYGVLTSALARLCGVMSSAPDVLPLFCVTVKVRPAMVSVPVRADPPFA
jgi:hypothetical protein